MTAFPLPSVARIERGTWVQAVSSNLKVLRTEFTQPWEEFSGLMVLDLVNRILTEPDFMQLSHLKNVRVLNLSGSNITDDTIRYLFTMSSLDVLYLRDTALSPKAIKKLRKKLPSCCVVA